MKWSRHIAEAIAKGEKTTERLIAADPGNLGETKMKNCLAYLELAKVIYYQRGEWVLSSYGHVWLKKAPKD